MVVVQKHFLSLREQATEHPHITRNPRSNQHNAPRCRLLAQALILFAEPTTGSQSLACGYLNAACIRRLPEQFYGARVVEKGLLSKLAEPRQGLLSCGLHPQAEQFYGARVVEKGLLSRLAEPRQGLLSCRWHPKAH